jgi:6-phosphogluconate dehydrogenase
MAKHNIGLIGLAVMGENLVLNMADHGFSVAVFNRTTSKVDDFINARAKGKNIKGCYSIEELMDSLEKPRKVMLMIKAGKPVDDFIELLIPHLDQSDIVIDGGNSYFPDSIRRTNYLQEKGFLFIGTGVSGGEEGALKGPSIMPGGSADAWPHVQPIFQAIAKSQEAWRQVIAKAVRAGIPVPAFSSALAYYDSYRSERLPANLLQAQRDYFGAHTYERVDKPKGEFFHTNWTGRGGSTSSTTYNV